MHSEGREQAGTPDLSIVVPCCNEEACVELFLRETYGALAKGGLVKAPAAAAPAGAGAGAAPAGAAGPSPAVPDAEIQVEFLFVDDGSTDATLSILRRLAANDPRVRYLSFSRNFGKEAAIFAGLEHARGRFVAVMDVDLQDPPALLPSMYKVVSGGACDIARARRVGRAGEPAVRSFFARCFYRLVNRMSDVEIVDGSRDYQLMNRTVVDAILRIREYNRFFKGISGWVGFKVKWFEFENEQRAAGETKWSTWGLFKYAFEGISSFSSTPLALASAAGLGCFGLAVVLIILIIVRALLFGDPVAGWPSTMCVILAIGGIQLLCLGILGTYLAKAYLEAKRRPLYLVAEDSGQLQEQ